MSTANAMGTTIAIVFVVCRLLVILAPDLMFSIAQSWFHGVELTKSASANVDPGSFLLGLVSSVASVWLIGYLFAVLHNRIVEK